MFLLKLCQVAWRGMKGMKAQGWEEEGGEVMRGRLHIGIQKQVTYLP